MILESFDPSDPLLIEQVAVGAHGKLSDHMHLELMI